MRKHTQLAWASVVLSAMFFGVLQAGPLTPPAGPVASTGKTQITSLPYTITQSGSYILTGNLTGVSGQNGISVDADNVTIDLNGFSLSGVPGSLNGIAPLNYHTGLSVTNGVIDGWGGDGVTTYDYIGFTPIYITPSRFDNLIVKYNGGNGMVGQYESVITNCISTRNAKIGIVLASASGAGAVENCIASNNGTSGFFISGGTVRGCSSKFNSGVGFDLQDRCTIVNCSATYNYSHGIRAISGVVIENCVCTYNKADGINVGGTCNVVANNCTNNGANAGGVSGAGIHILYNANRVEKNNVNYNDYGVLVDSVGNFVVENCARGNAVASYNITGAQTIGPIITATGTITTTNPWANFSY